MMPIFTQTDAIIFWALFAYWLSAPLVTALLWFRGGAVRTVGILFSIPWVIGTIFFLYAYMAQ